ncbi:MAG: DUF3108 domain-containing protein [Burkholderiales bacterium]|nr:DUF3108 domain-containing protein [Burkholderiales bacterium]
MNLGRPGRSRQLALLTVLVLTAHFFFLGPPARRLAPQRSDAPARFHTRSIVLAPAAAASLEPASPLPESPHPPAGAPAARGPEPAPAVPPAEPHPRKPAQAAASASVPSPSPAQAWPDSIAALPSAVLHYEVTARSRGFTLQGTASIRWQQDGQRYAARMELTAFGLRPRAQESTGEITPAGLLPERYSDHARSEQAAHFDRAGGRVSFSNNQPDAPLEAGMQDRLSLVFQLSMLAAAQPQRFTVGTDIVVPTATARDAQDWVFAVRGEEDLDLPGGPVRALKLERLPQREFDQKLELWLAPAQAYAPVRLRLTNPDGSQVDQRWLSTERP